MACLLMACHEDKSNPNKNLSLNAFADWQVEELAVNSHHIRECLDRLVRNDKGEMGADRQTRSYYGNRRPFLWIDRHGIDDRADTLLAWLDRVEEGGLSAELFRKSQIERDLQRIRTLDVGGDSVKDINRVLARLEYNLTRAWLRYCSGQHFGFVNPDQLLNHHFVKDSDSLHVTYEHVYDVPLRHAGPAFYHEALRKIASDSVSFFLREVQPVGKLYAMLCQRLKQTDLTEDQRLTTLCNIERCRWRQREYPDGQKKYVLVNIPAFRLFAVCPDSTLSMRVGCGTHKTKTPLLTSKIHRMDVNPVWIVPKSIAKDIVYRHDYLRRERMYIVDRKLGKQDVALGSYSKIMSGEQHIVQEGGRGNSLGRIIFRFANNHSVYLHDTSSPGFFQRRLRAVSHGCVRVQKPFELAVFLMKEKDETTIEKIRYSMTADVSRYDESDEKEQPDIDRSMLIHQLKVEPEIPVFITYYTLYTDENGQLKEYKDVYGYDELIIEQLKPYIKQS